MADFSPTQAAFEGFRLTRERPSAVAIWTAVLLLLNLLTTAVLIGMAGPELAEAARQGRDASPDPAEVMATVAAIGPAYLLVGLISLPVYAVLYTAVYRAVLRPEQGGAGFLRLGGDEWRVGLAMLVVFLILFGAYVALALLAGVVLGLVGGGSPDGASPGAGVVVLLAVLGMVGGLAWLGVRLSLVLPATFDRGRLQVGPAWALTRGRFWPLFGALLLAVALTIVVSLLALVVFSALAAALGGGLDGVGRMFAPDLSSLSAYFTPLAVLYLVFSSFLTALGTAITVGVTAEAYREIARTGERGSSPAG